jgi:hypothetical protein
MLHWLRSILPDADGILDYTSSFSICTASALAISLASTLATRTCMLPDPSIHQRHQVLYLYHPCAKCYILTSRDVSLTVVREEGWSEAAAACLHLDSACTCRSSSNTDKRIWRCSSTLCLCLYHEDGTARIGAWRGRIPDLLLGAGTPRPHPHGLEWSAGLDGWSQWQCRGCWWRIDVTKKRNGLSLSLQEGNK